MNLGWLDVCLRVADVRTSRAFYERLGFHRVEGDDAEGWAVVVHGEARLGLFQPEFMETGPFSLNFRGGDVAAIAQALEAQGCPFDQPLRISPQGGASARLRDPDGYPIFLDAAPGETKPV